MGYSTIFRSIVTWAVFLLFSVTAVQAAHNESTILAPLTELYTLLTQHPLIAPLLFIIIYTLAVTLLLPGALICLLGGILFGPWAGTILNVLGATLGASLAFVISRHFAAKLVERHLGKILRRLKQGVELQGWRFVALVRLIPVVPYDLSNYAFGLTRIPLLQFASATAVCLLPRIAAYTYIGHSSLSLLHGEGDQLINLVGMGTLLIAVLLLPYLYGRIRQPLNRPRTEN